MRPFLALPKILAILALALHAAACGDAVTDPQGLSDSAEVEAMLQAAETLPTLPALIRRAGVPEDAGSRAALRRASELWSSAIGDDAMADRRRAVRYAAPALEDRIGPAEWDEVERELRAWDRTVRTMLRHVRIPGLEERLESAGRHLARAAAAPDVPTRARALLRAGAELAETTPRPLAVSLVERAESGVGGASAAVGPEDLARAERLKDWARRAVEEGDYLVAIHRAYYALQLVEAQ